MFYQAQHFGSSEYFFKDVGKDVSFPLHMHFSFEFIMVLEGNMTVQIGNDVYDLIEGEGVVIFPEQLHSLKSTQSKHLLIIFSADMVNAYYSRYLSEIPKNSRIRIPPYLLSLLSEIEKSSPMVKIKAVLYLICSILDESGEYISRNAVENNLLYTIFEFVEKNLEKDCSLEVLSQATGYNRSYLSRYFSKATGMSYVSFVNQRRISKACYMLKNSPKAVIECAYDCGYRSLRSFNRSFKTYTGTSPRAYRSNL